ncbi:MAG: hypothetical protein LBS33_02360 [Streptococcaceae bacterium]|nr:hypothetical protein [Streptococcaceae bacterium]
MADSIKKIDEKLMAFETFNANTNSLFQDTCALFENLQHAVNALNGIKISGSGSRLTLSIPSNVSELVNKTRGSKLTAGESKHNKQVKYSKNYWKTINDLYKKNPSMAIEKIKDNPDLFSYTIHVLDKFPKEFQDKILDIFILKENWDQLPKKAALELLANPRFVVYLEKLPVKTQGVVYAKLVKLNEKGWEVLAPIGYLTSVLSKNSKGAKVIASSKVGLSAFKKFDKVSKFLKAHPVAKESIGYAGDGLTVVSNAYEEYINPKSPAYGNVSKSIYGGINIFLIEAGPLEGAQYGGPVGAIAGSINMVGYYGKDIINSIPKIWGDNDGFGWEKSEEGKKKWLEEQYRAYDERQKNLEEGNVEEVKKDWFGEQTGRVDVNDFNNGLPRW